MKLPEYRREDWQLLAEIALAIHHARLVPLSLLRVMAARGWVQEPDIEDTVEVQVLALSDGVARPYPCANTRLGVPHLTLVGERELDVFRAEYPVEEWEDLFEDADD